MEAEKPLFSQLPRAITKRERSMLTPICAKYNCDPDRSRFVICEGRKVGFLLKHGNISTRACFRKGCPVPSPRNAAGLSQGAEGEQLLTLVPDGWTIALVVKRAVYIGEICYRGDQPQYRFSLVKGAKLEQASPWLQSPGPAFAQVQLDKTPGSEPNGKLLIGVVYSESQRLLREEFARREPRIPADCLGMFAQWIHQGGQLAGLHLGAMHRRMLGRARVDCDQESFCSSSSPSGVADEIMENLEAMNAAPETLKQAAPIQREIMVTTSNKRPRCLCHEDDEESNHDDIDHDILEALHFVF